MAELLKNLFGGAKPDQVPVVKDSDFADFAGAPAATDEAFASPSAGQVKWTKWYNVHERHSLSEFKAEGAILLVAAVILLFHILGARANRTKARQWMRAHGTILKSEFASVGFRGQPTADADLDSAAFLREKSLFEFASYATGRQNVAFMDVKLTLRKRFNPALQYVESAAAFVFDAMPMPQDVVEATIYPFDGKEDLTVPPLPGLAERAASGSTAKSTFDGFVWAVVNKDSMQQLRSERYDLSLTATKDHVRLPGWLTVMSESAEITETLLTQELIDAVTAAGDRAFDYLIVSDQPVDKPATVEEATAPRKRLFLRYRLPSATQHLLPLFAYFVRMPDALVRLAHFRPEVMRRVKATRDSMTAQIKRLAEEEKSEERALEKDKAKKAKRDAELKGLDAKAQKKYLEKEREKELRKSQKKMAVRA